MVLLILVMSTPASAQLTDSICVSEALGDPSGNFCTANDVRITEFECVDCPEVCVPGFEYTATLLATVEAGPDRYGIGLWFNEDGLGAKTPNAECTRDILSPAGPNNQCGELGPFWDANGDACGDVTQDATACPGVVIAPCTEGGGDCAFFKKEVTVTTVCADTDGDDIADISSCTSWDQNPATCNSIGDAVPGTKSKCHCSAVSTGEIFTGCLFDAQCNDGVSCTSDTCDLNTNECVFTPDDNVCNDGAFCNGVETCDPVNDCQAGTPVDCNDGVGCTVDACNEGTDSCDNTPDDNACSDGAFCNGVETCDPANDCQAGAPVDCNDGVGCTVDACNEGTDSCDNTPDDNACSDGAFCNGVETCDPTNDCQAGTPVDCNDGVGCTVDACNEGTDSCDNTPDDNVCNDDAFCNGVETCDPTNDCQAGTPVDCNDGVGCTVDACNEGTDSCDNTPDDNACDDLAFCNGVETCDPVNDCQAGTPVDCNDGVGCTVDACNEGTDSCDNTPDDNFCDNGLWCDGGETCDATNDCQAGTPPDCSDGVGCTVDTCNEGSDSCDNTPDDGLCADGNVCNGPEFCDAALGCQGGEPLPFETPCGDQTDTACTDPDYCDGAGNCLNNNEVCGAVTTSALCEFDVEPDKGVCVGGEGNGEACSMGDPTSCEEGGGTCEQENQFRLAFGPDAQNWVAYRPPYTNPGQFYYNAFYDGSTSGGDGEMIAIQVPWPFITQGATPLHVYDGDAVGTLDTCFTPGSALMAEKFVITQEDWLDPTSNPPYLTCDQVQGPGGSGFCTLILDIPQAVIDATLNDLLYINLHMDYGLKGNFTDANPFDGFVDAYDRGGQTSPWGSAHALEDTLTNDGMVAIADCSDYNFAHFDEGGLLFDDTVQNLNEFHKFDGIIGQVSCNYESPIGGFVWLRGVNGPNITSAEIDLGGFFSIGYKHQGEAADYRLRWCDQLDCSGDRHTSWKFTMQANDSVAIDLVATGTCSDLHGWTANSDWKGINPIYP